MKTPVELRDELLATLDHIRSVFKKAAQATAPKKGTLRPPDLHKISEGLFLSAWTHWEEFIRKLMIVDLESDTDGILRKEVKKFRTALAAARLAERIINHPDAKRWVEWSEVNDIVERANVFLGANHRYGVLSSCKSDFETLKRIRNAVAHKSDRAWESFSNLVKGHPFSLTPKQMRGITTGRFLSSHSWNSNKVMEEVITKLEDAAKQLVP